MSIQKRIRFGLQLMLRIGFFVGILFGMHLLIAWHLVSWLGLQGVLWDFTVATWSCLVVFFTYLYGRMIRKPRWLHLVLVWIGSYVFVVFEWVIVWCVLFQVVYWPIKWSGMAIDTDWIVWFGWIGMGLIFVGLLWGSYQAWSPVVRRYSVKIAKSATDGRKSLKIVMFSDVHVGRTVGVRHVRRLVRLVNQLEPELILIAGDVLDDDVCPFLDLGIDRLLGELKADLGVFAILGNHEYFGGGISKYVQAMRAQGIDVLMDQVVELEGIGFLAGRKDRTAESFYRGDGKGRMSLKQLIEGVNPNAPLFLMDHQPYGLAHAAECGVDLIVSGHTHRGQIFPNQWITAKIFELDWGYRMFGKMHAVVSSGFGTWGPPVRIGSRAEVVELLLEFHS